MAYFLLTSRDGSHSVIVSGKCLSCARSIAAANAGAEGPQVWRNSGQSDIKVLRDTDAPGFVFKGAVNNDDG